MLKADKGPLTAIPNTEQIFDKKKNKIEKNIEQQNCFQLRDIILTHIQVAVLFQLYYYAVIDLVL